MINVKWYVGAKHIYLFVIRLLFIILNHIFHYHKDFTL